MDSGKIEGIAGSPGVVEGMARVVMSEDEFDSLQSRARSSSAR